MLSQPARNVNTPIEIDSLFDGDARQVNRADRLAMTAAEMIRAAENRWNCEYRYGRVYQGGYGYVECVMPEHDPQAAPWVHLLPLPEDWKKYLVRGTGAQYGAPDWQESELMHERLLDSQAAEWLADYQQYIAENGIGDPNNLEDMS